jgi:hypothetical protein
VLRAKWSLLSRITVLSKPIEIPLKTGTKPRASLVGGIHPSIDVQASPGASGRLRYAEEAECPGYALLGPSYIQEAVWKIADGNRIKPVCAQPLRWRVLAGWVGHPVVLVDYVKH